MKVPVLVIGGGLSGLAAAIRIARFISGSASGSGVLLVEKHKRLGGLNSYYFRNNTLFETGLHAVTNYAEAGDKRAPLNRLLRQLKLSRSSLSLCPQYGSSIFFTGCTTLHFSNDLNLLQTEIAEKFPTEADNFQKLLRFINEFDPFLIAPFRSARQFLEEVFHTPLLIDMLLCPLMYYGSSVEEDMDLAQFAIMFRAIFLEGMFRPESSIKEFLDIFIGHLTSLGGEIRTGCGVRRIIPGKHGGSGKYGLLAELENGEEITCDYALSTIGAEETMALIEPENSGKTRTLPGSASGISGSSAARLAFVENIFQLRKEHLPAAAENQTITFFNEGEKFHYRKPLQRTDTKSGVICFPSGFQGIHRKDLLEIRTTHLANYGKWAEKAEESREAYRTAKKEDAAESAAAAEKIIGSFRQHTTFHDMFTPLTIKRYTGKIEGAIYGCPQKIKDGTLGYENLFLAGTDQGFLGIVGSMLSGVSVVNQHILPKL